MTSFDEVVIMLHL